MSKSESTKKYTWLSWANEKIQEAEGPKNVLSISPEMVHFCDGNHKYAAFYTHLLFWSAHSETGWVYKTWKDWFREAGLVQADVDSATKHFLARNLLSKKIKKAKNGSPTVHYQIDGKGFETAFAAYLEYRKSMEWESQKSRIRFEKFSAIDFPKSKKTSNRTDNKTNKRTNIQTSPLPPKGPDKHYGKEKLPPLDDPMCIKIAEICQLDPQINQRTIRQLVHALRLAGYEIDNINKIDEVVRLHMNDFWFGNITPSLIKQHILETREEEDRKTSFPPTMCVIAAGKPKLFNWKIGAEEGSTCLACKAPIRTSAYSPDNKATKLYCSKECLATIK